MKIIIHNTDKIVEVNGLPGRIWEGKTEGGQDITCVITRIAVPMDADHSQFERELKETPVVKPVLDAFPPRMIL